MARGEEYALDERKERFQEEEQLGLLDEEADHEDNRSSEDVESRDWDFEEGIALQNSRKRNWFKILVISVPVVWLLGFIIHIFWLPNKTIPTATTTAQLRAEEDYILDPNWDSDGGSKTREYHWTIAEHVLNPDGVYRPMTLINAAFPGPLIECNEGDEIIVHVQNKATNATAIHWHGLFQNGTNYMDGTVGITQCPIAPSHSFTYRFSISGQSGTYWYHSHMAMQASDGLVGPIVIHAKSDGKKKLQRVPYVEDRVVLVSDHYYDLSSSLLWQYLRPGNENDEPVPQAAVINGRGMRNCSHLPNRNCSAIDRSNAVFHLSSVHNTRLRFINVGAFAEFQIQIDEHEFQLTEVDGVDVHPQSIHRLDINPAQRYSIIVSPPDQNQGLYWMRARMITHCFAYEEPELSEEVRGIIRYSQTPDTEETPIPQSKDWPEIIEVECKDLNTSTLSPVEILALPSKADDVIYLRSSFQIGDWRLSRGFLNDSSYRANLSHPTLSSFTTAVQQKSPKHVDSLSTPYGLNTHLFDPHTTLVYQTSGIRTIDILLQNFDDGNHPFHLHGHVFWVLASGHGYPPSALRNGDTTQLDLSNPLRRDTASLEAFGWTLIRFVADNPGIWAFHCHIGWHNEAGLSMQFLERADVLAQRSVPREVEALCGVEGMEKGKGPDDGTWVGKWD